MEYKLTIPKVCGDVIPLIHVAETMAKARATAYGMLPLHQPVYKGALGRFVTSLYAEARDGRLFVCDGIGCPGTVDKVIADAINAGGVIVARPYPIEPDWERLRCENPSDSNTWDFSHLDLGPSETDWVMTHIACLYAKLFHLNEWGKSRGDVFSVGDEWIDWVDERGIITDPRSKRPVSRESKAERWGRFTAEIDAESKRRKGKAGALTAVAKKLDFSRQYVSKVLRSGPGTEDTATDAQPTSRPVRLMEDDCRKRSAKGSPWDPLCMSQPGAQPPAQPLIRLTKKKKP